jgi:hypothetical protein
MGIIFFNFSFGFANASEGNVKEIYDDIDGVNDDFQELNKRDIGFEFGENEIHGVSVRRNGTVKDYISILIFYGEDGIGVSLRYKSKFGEESEFLLVFGVIFREIIEFVDLDEDGIFHPENDKVVQEFPLNKFKPAFHNVSEDSTLHYIRIQTLNNIFTAHLYFVEEFVIKENSLITPNQFKIDIEINNFDYLNESSQLALNTRLEQKEVTVGDIFNEENGQRLYFSYNRGEHIYHDPKLGIEDILISPPLPRQFNPTFLIILITVLAALSVGVAYTTYHAKHKLPATDLERDRDEHFTELFEEDRPELPDTPYNGRAALNLFDSENAIEKLIQVGDINITLLSKDFFDVVNRFEWEGDERSLFIGEMLALSPLERESILKEMITKSHT